MVVPDLTVTRGVLKLFVIDYKKVDFTDLTVTRGVLKQRSVNLRNFFMPNLTVTRGVLKPVSEIDGKPIPRI